MSQNRLVLFMMLLMGVLMGCGLSPDAAPPPDTITVEDAQALLHEAVDYAQAGDVEALCGMGGSVSICERALEDAGGLDAVPQSAPTVVDSHIFPAVENSTGGRVLVLEGQDGLGRPYRTDFLVFYIGDGEELAVFMPVYWSGIGMQPITEPETITASPAPWP